MAADPTQERSGFSALLNDLSDGDVVIEAGATGSSPEAGSIQLLRDAVEASYRALAGPVGVKLDTVAVVEEVSKRSTSLWLRVQGQGADPSLQKFLARGTLAIIAWMDGSSTLQLADLQQAIRVLAWGTSITTTAHPALPSSAELVSAISAWQHAKGAMLAPDEVDLVARGRIAALGVAAVRRSGKHPRDSLQQRLFRNGHDGDDSGTDEDAEHQPVAIGVQPAGEAVHPHSSSLGGRAQSNQAAAFVDRRFLPARKSSRPTSADESHFRPRGRSTAPRGSRGCPRAASISLGWT